MKQTICLLLLFTINNILNAQTPTWMQTQKIVALDREAADQYGSAVSIEGTTAVVGAPFDEDDENGSNPLNQAGSAYILEKNANGEWQELQKIVASDRESLAIFGSAVSIHGNYIAVGASRESKDVNGGNPLLSAGAVYLFERQANGLFVEVQKLVASDRDANDLFAQSVAIEGNTLVVGAILEDEDENGLNTLLSAGSAYVFERNGTTGMWAETQKIVASNRSFADLFGTSIALEANQLIVGARSAENQSGVNGGAAYVFNFDSTTSQWQETQVISISDSNTSQFGGQVSISGNLLAIGAPNYNSQRGLVQTYTLNTTTQLWSFGTNIEPNLQSGDSFGFFVSLQGNQLAVGSFSETDSNGQNPLNDAGAAYFIELSVNGAVNTIQKVVASDRQGNDNFSYVALANNEALVGAPLQDFDENGGDQVANAGAVYHIVLNTPPTIVCPSLVTLNNDPGVCGALVNLTISASDPEDGSLTPVQTGGPANGTVFPVGTSTVEFTVTDSAGATDVCSFDVIVNDIELPTVACQNITVTLDASGETSITVSDVDAGTTDNCNLDSVSINIDQFTCDDIGVPVKVTLTALDVNGNTASCVAEVTVVDELAPEVFCPPNTLVTINEGDVFELPDYFAEGDASSTDNCTASLDIVNLQDPPPGTLLTEGVYTISFTATDASGNNGTCAFELEVEELLSGESFNAGNFTVYPNPATNYFNISNPNQKSFTGELYSAIGSVIRVFDNDTMSHDISQLASGMYFILIETKSEKSTFTLIKN